MTTVLTNVRPADGRAPAFHTSIDGGVFSRLDVSESGPPGGAFVIDGTGKLAIPGFVNAHTHLAMVLLRGLAEDRPLDRWLTEVVWPIERMMTASDVYWSSLLALAESVRAGVTCVSDMYFSTHEVARAVEESGLRAVLSYGMVAESLDHGGREELAKARETLQQWHNAAGGRIRVAVAPHSVYTVGQDVWEGAIDLAEQYGTLLHTHVCETRLEVEQWKAKTGMSPVTYLDRIGAFSVPLVAAHCVHIDAADVELLAQRGACVAHCPKSNAKLGSGTAPVPAMLEAGIPVALGTDGAASNNRLDILEEARFACLLQRATREDPGALTAQQGFDMATFWGRQALGLPLATFEAGAQADAVLIDGEAIHDVPSDDPIATLLYSSTAADVTDVVVGGSVLMKDRQLLTIDEEKAKHEVKSLRRRITQ